MPGLIRGILVGVVLMLIVGVVGYFLLKASSPQTTASTLTNCGNGVYVQVGSNCPGASANVTIIPGNNATQPPQQIPTQPPAPTAIPTQPQQTNSIVSTTGGPCPTGSFDLKKGMATCNFSGNGTLICEGDINDSLGTHHDADNTTGQVTILDKAATIDGRDNGGSCHPMPPWTLDMSVSSVKDGCKCSTIQVWKDGSMSQTL